MTGIVSFGCYLPKYKMSRKIFRSAMGWLNPFSFPGSKAVANHDEDAITMAVAAAMNALEGVRREMVKGLYFATTTAPYRERESAAIIATALNLPSNIWTIDFSNSLRAGVSALLQACEFVKAEGSGYVVVCASDCRLGKPGAYQEMAFGDAAACFVIGNDPVITSFEASHCVSYDFPDHWRMTFDKFDRASEDRWIRDEGYFKFVQQAVNGLIEKCGLQAKDLDKIIYPCFSPRDHAALGRKMGFTRTQIQDPLFESIGDSGTAGPLLALASALEQAEAGATILVTGYGSGCAALLFKVAEKATSRLPRISLSTQLASREELSSYEKYLAFRGIIPVELGPRGEVGPTAIPLAWRERKAILGLVGSRCKRCGTPHYPPQRICVNPDCGATDKMEDYEFSRRKAVLFSYTEDHLASTICPPQIYGMLDFEGGGRFVFDITDCEPGSLEVGMPMEMTFRRKYLDEARGICGYCWKAMPVRQ